MISFYQLAMHVYSYMCDEFNDNKFDKIEVRVILEIIMKRYLMKNEKFNKNNIPYVAQKFGRWKL